jgi:hypothetical protein
MIRREIVDANARCVANRVDDAFVEAAAAAGRPRFLQGHGVSPGFGFCVVLMRRDACWLSRLADPVQAPQPTKIKDYKIICE